MIQNCFSFLLVYLIAFQQSYSQQILKGGLVIDGVPDHIQQQDSVQLHKKAVEKLENFQLQGYLETSLDSILKKKDTLLFFISKGKFIDFTSADFSGIEPQIIERSGIRFRKNRELSHKDYSANLEKLLIYLENNGYPFAQIIPDSMYQDENKIRTTIRIDKGPMIMIDSIIIKGNAKQPVSYISNYSGVKPGDLYNESLIAELETRLKEISFLNIKKGPDVEFMENKAKIFIYADRRNANQFDGVAGIQSDPKTDKVSLTGELRLKLINSLKKAESIEIDWKRAQTLTQEINAYVAFPVLMRSAFGLDGGIKVYKRDTSFTDINMNAGIMYSLKSGRQLRVFTHRRSTFVLTQAPSSLASPELADIDVQSFGIGLREEHLDYRINPRKGYRILVSGSAGERKIRIDPDLPETVYKDIDLVTTQFNATLHAELFIPVKRRSALLIAIKGAGLEGENIFKNEQIRFGGFRTLRGFDEESIFADKYAVGTLEYRFLNEENAHLFLFFDQGVYHRTVESGFITDKPWGTGAGITFQSKAGIFSISYAVGKQFNNPLNLRAAKIHFGLVNYF